MGSEGDGEGGEFVGFLRGIAMLMFPSWGNGPSDGRGLGAAASVGRFEGSGELGELDGESSYRSDIRAFCCWGVNCGRGGVFASGHEEGR